MRKVINYSQCWEDPIIVIKALQINSKDEIVSITSGGDNTLALLTASPKKVVSIDSNAAQTYLLELKMAAINRLDYEEALELIGIKNSVQRIHLYENIKFILSNEAQVWWANNQSLIKRGIINVGRFERFLHLFRSYLLPLIHSRKIIFDFFKTNSLDDQRRYYRDVWSSHRWRFLFTVITNRFILRHFARQRGMFDYTESGAVTKEYLKRLDWNFTNVPLTNNYFMYYCLLGTFGTSLPPYLDSSNTQMIKDNYAKLSLVTSNLLDYLKTVPDNSFSKFNLSDIFEALSLEKSYTLWEEIVRTAKNGARIVYWNNLVPRSFPPRLAGSIKDERELTKRLHSEDRIFFYGSLHINTIQK